MGSTSKLPSSAVYFASRGHANVSKSPEDLLMWHATLRHYNTTHTQRLLSDSDVETEPILSPREPGIKTYYLPLFVSCLRGKERATSVASTTGITNAEHFNVIKDGYLTPWDTLSTYQYECRVKGRLPNTRRREDPAKIYCGGTLFNDHGSFNADVYHQVSLECLDTIRSKAVYEQESNGFEYDFVLRGANHVLFRCWSTSAKWGSWKRYSHSGELSKNNDDTLSSPVIISFRHEIVVFFLILCSILVEYFA